MVALGLLPDNPDPLIWLARDASDDVRSAAICWGVALAVLVIFRVPRQVVVACLLVATVTVGLAALVVDTVPPRVDANHARSEPSAPTMRALPPWQQIAPE